MKLNNKYIIMRHGQTVYQTKKRFLIYPNKINDNVLLTKEGVKQVEQSVQKLKKENIDLIFASDFHRTKKTANMVAREKGLKVYFDQRLRDVNLGDWHGKKKEEFYIKFPKFSRKLFYEKPKGGESWPDCKKRIVLFLKDLEKKHKNKTILIVSHGDPLWLLEGYVKGLTNPKLADKKQEFFLRTGKFKKLK